MAFGSTVLTNAGTNNIFVAAYDTAGNVFWAKSISGASDDRGNAIAVDAANNTYATGYFTSSSLAFGSTSLPNAGGNDLFVAKAGSITGIQENAGQPADISVFPNPGNGTFELQLKGMAGTGTQVTITNMLGQIVYEAKEHSSLIGLHIQNPGVYFVTVQSGSQSACRKVIVN